jgi:hypothetical protein
MGSNRGWFIIAAIFAGFVWGVLVGAWFVYAVVTPDWLLKSVSPQQLLYSGREPQYRDFYAARAATRFVELGGAAKPEALSAAREVLGVASGDVTPIEAVDMVRAAHDIARAENGAESNPDLGRFTMQDQLNLAALGDRLDAVRGEVVAEPGTGISDRNAFLRLWGLVFVLLVGALAGLILWLLSRGLSLADGPAVVRRADVRMSPQPRRAEIMPEDDVEGTLEDDLDDPIYANARVGARGAPLDVTSDSDLAEPRAVHTPVAPSHSEQLISTFNTQYEIGDDDYDEGFQINGANGELIGELGATASERVGLEMPYKFAVLLVWVFDKLDFQSTTKVLMTDYAYNDSAIKDKLKVRGDLILARNGTFEIVTQSMRVEIEVSGLDFAPVGNEPHGYFENADIQFRVYRRPPGAALT